MSREQNGKTKKRGDIQILRAISVLAVIVFHLEERWLPGGFLGVDVFFVISGFLITGIIIRALNSGIFSIRGFYLRRIKRLFPALAVMLLVTLVLGIVALPPLPFHGLTLHAPAAALQISNFSFMRETDYFGPDNENNPLLHTWSLGVEEQYYLTWAPLLALGYLIYRSLRKKESDNYQPWILLSTIVVGGIVLELLTVDRFGKTISFFSPISRSWELALGGLAAMGLTAGRPCRSVLFVGLSLAGYAAMTLSFFYLDAFTAANPFLRAIPCMGAFAALRYPIPPVPARLLRLPRDLLIYIGDISYSLYLWHWPVICMMPYLLATKSQVLSHSFSVLAFTAFSILSYHFVEQRFMHEKAWSRLLGWRTGLAFAFLLLVAGGGLALQSEADASWRFDGGTPTAEERSYKEPLPYPEMFKNRGRETVYREVEEAEIVLIGDSHARHFHPAVRAWARERGKEVCVFYAGGFFLPGVNSASEELDFQGNVTRRVDRSRISRRLLSHLTASGNVEIVFLALRSAFYTQESLPYDKKEYARRRVVTTDGANLSSDECYAREVKGFVQALVDKEIKVVLLGQVPPLNRLPKPGASMLDQLLRRDWSEGNTQLNEEESKRLELEDKVYRQLAADPKVQHFRSRSYLTSTYTEDGYFLYDDGNHINYQGAMYLFPELNKINWPSR